VNHQSSASLERLAKFLGCWEGERILIEFGVSDLALMILLGRKFNEELPLMVVIEKEFLR
jgi:hypothetical protein